MQTLSIANDQPRPTILSGRIPSLDGLRAVSILLVVVCHLAATVDSPLPGRPSWYFNGAVGVDVFFAISGFLITTLLLRESERSGTISISRFYLRRALRILPAFWFYLTVLALLNRFGWVHLVGRDWIAALTYTVNFFLPTAYAVRHIWSLSVEEHFYIVWPLLFAFLGRNRATKLAIVYLLSEPVIRWLTWRYFRGDLDIDFVTFARLDAIAAGCVMAVVARIPTSRSPLKRLDENPAVWFFAALFILLLSVCVLSLSGKYGILLRPTVNRIGDLRHDLDRRPFSGHQLRTAAEPGPAGVARQAFVQPVHLAPGLSRSVQWPAVDVQVSSESWPGVRRSSGKLLHN